MWFSTSFVLKGTPSIDRFPWRLRPYHCTYMFVFRLLHLCFHKNSTLPLYSSAILCSLQHFHARDPLTETSHQGCWDGNWRSIFEGYHFFYEKVCGRRGQVMFLSYHCVFSIKFVRDHCSLRLYIEGLNMKVLYWQSYILLLSNELVLPTFPLPMTKMAFCSSAMDTVY